MNVNTISKREKRNKQKKEEKKTERQNTGSGKKLKEKRKNI